MPYGDDNQTVVQNPPVLYDRRAIAAQRFQQQQARLPLADALAMAKLQKEQAALEFQGRAQLDAENTETQVLKQGAAFYAGKPVLEKYLRDNNMPVGSPGHAEAYANYASQFPYALRHLPDVAKTVQEHAEVHDLKATMDQAVSALGGTIRPGQSVEVNAQGQPIVKAGASMDEQSIQRYSRVQGELAGAKTLQAAESARQAKANAGTPNVPYNPSDPLAVPIEAKIKAAETESALLTKNLPALSAPAPSATAVPAGTSIPDNSQGAPQPQPAATPNHLGRYNPETGEFE